LALIIPLFGSPAADLFHQPAINPKESQINTVRFFLRYVLLGLAVAVVALLISNSRWYDKQPAVAPATIETLRASFADGVESAAPAVVNIYVDKIIQQRQVFRDPQLQRFAGRVVLGPPRLLARSELGSGVIINAEGYILTNFHVIRDANDIQVALWDGRITDAQVIGFDQETDLAVLKTGLDNLPTLPHADVDALRIGDVVLAIGNPFGLGKTVTMGIVSATGRKDLHISTYENFIQTDAAINRGNSGGALIDAAGQLVGINTAMLGRQDAEGIGFAIPIDMATDVFEQIIDNGRVIRGWLGIEAEDGRRFPRHRALAQGERGVVVSRVYRGGPGERAGLQPNDYLTDFNDQPITNLRDLLENIAKTDPGTQVPISFWRGGQKFTTQTTLIQRPARLETSG
jgi:serine peptidase DegS